MGRYALLPTLSNKERVVLELLVNNPGSKYGLQLVEESRGRLKRGTVYVTLGRMEQKGLIESEQAPAPLGQGGLPRRLYRATGHGIRVLQVYDDMSRALAGGREWVMDAQ